MFQSYVFILAIGCTVTTTCALLINPYPYTFCKYNCNRAITCFAFGPVEWLYPNFTVINTTDETAKIHVQNKTLVFNNPDVSDAGSYTCRLKRNNSVNATTTLKIRVFMHTSSSQLYEVKTALRYHDTFINCSILPANTQVIWKYRNTLLDTRNSDKYMKNSSGLIIYNVTDDDEEQYVCLSLPFTLLQAYIKLNVKCAPELLSAQNQIVTVKVSEEVVLNCTVSASPDPVYTWSFPESCSSCPSTNNDSVLIFTAEDITDSGEYTCVAENEYNNLSVVFYVTVTIPPTFVFSNDLILLEEKIVLLGSNVFINCSVNYGTEYNITSWLFDYEPLLINQTSKFSQNTSGLTIYNVNKLNEGNYTCYVDQLLASILVRIKFKSQELKIFIKNLTDCQDLEKLQTIHRTVKELIQSLQKWFSSVCECDGHNNLLHSNLTCVNENTGIITSTVHHNGLLSAEELVNLARADIQTRNPPVVHLPRGWILCLNISSESKAETESSSSSTFLGLSMMIVVGVASLCTILALLLCISIGIIYVKYRRLDTKDSSKEDDSPHFYDEIDELSKNRSSAADDDKRFSEDEVVFDATTSWMPQQNEDSLYDIVAVHTQSPGHQLTTAISANDDEWKFHCNYEIMGLKKQSTKEKS